VDCSAGKERCRDAEEAWDKKKKESCRGQMISFTLNMKKKNRHSSVKQDFL